MFNKRVCSTSMCVQQVVCLCVFFNKCVFFVNVSKCLKFTTIEYIPNRTKGSLVKSIDKITRCYRTRDIVVCTLFADPKFDFLEDRIKHTKVNTTATQEHVPEVERKIRNIKIICEQYTPHFHLSVCPIVQSNLQVLLC